MAGDLNREASELWNSLKPIIDKEIDARTQGVVQRRKAKVTTAPSLVTNTIGVTEPFGTEMFLPFNTNIMSASVGDFVWVEYMYGMTNAFVSMFASADDKNQYVAGNLTVGGVLDVTPRRCYAELSSAGWKRALTINTDGRGGWGFVIDINITRSYDNGNNEVHSVKLQGIWDNFAFVDESSKTNYFEITKIRYTKDAANTGHVDIYYGWTGSGTNAVAVDFSVHTYTTRQANFVAASLESVAASPSGETVLTEYTFAANTNGAVTSSFSTSKGSVYAYRSGDMVTVTFVGNSTTWTEDEVFMTIADGIRPALSMDVVAYIGRQAVIVRINQNGNIVLRVGSTLTGNQRLYFSATYPISH